MEIARDLRRIAQDPRGNFAKRFSMLPLSTKSTLET